MKLKIVKVEDAGRGVTDFYIYEKTGILPWDWNMVGSADSEEAARSKVARMINAGFTRRRTTILEKWWKR